MRKDWAMTQATIIQAIQQSNHFYLHEDDRFQIKFNDTLKAEEIVFYKIDEITYEDQVPRKEALENVISTMQIVGVNFFYLILGSKEKVSFYYGISKDLVQKVETQLNIEEIGETILKPSLEGNFRGSKVQQVEHAQKVDIIQKIQDMQYNSNLDGVPGINEEREKFQGVDRLVDVMLGDEFAVLVVGKQLMPNAVRKIESNIYNLYDRLAPLSKKTIQESSSVSQGIGKTKTTGTNNSKGQNYTKTEQNGSNWGKSDAVTKTKSKSVGSGSNSGSEGTNTAKTDNTGGSTSISNAEGTSVTDGVSNSIAEATNSSKSTSNSENIECVNKEVQDWLQYISDVVLQRIDYGRGKGMFLTTLTLFTKKRNNLIKLENTMKSLYSGQNGNKAPLCAVNLRATGNRANALKNFQIPIGEYLQPISQEECSIRSALSQYSTTQRTFLGNWMSVNELSLIAGLPQKEIVGLGLREEVEFGLNYKNDVLPENEIQLGKLVQSGNVLEQIMVSLDKNDLNKHTFITGVTGSGKTTTCHNILFESELPFMVIEPAKTEYRILMEQFDDLLIFTLGKDKVAPFRLNPFEFFPHESITSRVDMIKASIEAAFDMEAAIPQIIESAIYACYEDYGWDITDDSNNRFADPFADGVYAFPTIEDLIKKTETVVHEQGFDDRLKNDYIGSIRARLQGLLVGSKGLMLNTRRSVDFMDLLNRKVIIELEEIRSSSEKALIMGFILTNLLEAIKANYLKNGTFQHILLIEEAHRLLSRYMPGDSLNKKQGVETFSDMLAEIRKYGESLIIVDQIPGKLTPDVLKNTNTKIVHKLFAQDDKDAIGNTMSLTDEQKKFLSELDTGRAVVFSQGWHKSLQVQMKHKTNTTSSTIIEEDLLRQRAIVYYKQYYRKGIFPGIDTLQNEPSYEEFEQNMKLFKKYKEIDNYYINLFTTYKVDCEAMREVLETLLAHIGTDGVVKYLAKRFYFVATDQCLTAIQALIQDCLQGENFIGKYDNPLAYERRA